MIKMRFVLCSNNFKSLGNVKTTRDAKETNCPTKSLACEQAHLCKFREKFGLGAARASRREEWGEDQFCSLLLDSILTHRKGRH